MIDREGAVLRSTCLGTGINQALATEHGEFWVAFGDIGIFDRVGEGRHGECEAIKRLARGLGRRPGSRPDV